MTTSKDDPPASSPAADGGVTEEEVRAAAAGIVEVMRAALEAAVEAAPKPAWALAGLLLAARSLRGALPQVTTLTEEDLEEALSFVRETYVGEAKAACVATACGIVEARCTHAHADVADVEAVVREAASCLDGLGRSGAVQHPITMLVVLYAARQMAFALLKHRYPDEYEHLCLVARAMENAVKPKAIGVVEIPNDMNFTKGGSA